MKKDARRERHTTIRVSYEYDITYVTEEQMRALSLTLCQRPIDEVFGVNTEGHYKMRLIDGSGRIDGGH